MRSPPFISFRERKRAREIRVQFPWKPTIHHHSNFTHTYSKSQVPPTQPGSSDPRYSAQLKLRPWCRFEKCYFPSFLPKPAFFGLGQKSFWVQGHCLENPPSDFLTRNPIQVNSLGPHHNSCPEIQIHSSNKQPSSDLSDDPLHEMTLGRNRSRNQTQKETRVRVTADCDYESLLLHCRICRKVKLSVLSVLKYLGFFINSFFIWSKMNQNWFNALSRSSEGLCEQSSRVSRLAPCGDESWGDGSAECPPTTGHPQGHRCVFLTLSPSPFNPFSLIICLVTFLRQTTSEERKGHKSQTNHKTIFRLRDFHYFILLLLVM